MIELLGTPYDQRGAWTDEAIQIMRVCWRDERASFSGRFFSFPEVGLAPKPARGTIPIWIGGHSPRGRRRVAERRNGWHAAFASPDVMRKGLADLKTACAKIGRDPSGITLSIRMGLSARRPAQEVIDELKALRDIGVTHVIVENPRHRPRRHDRAARPLRHRSPLEVVGVLAKYAPPSRSTVSPCPHLTGRAAQSTISSSNPFRRLE